MRLHDFPSIPALIRDAARRFSEAPALTWSRSAGGHGLTYAQLAQQMEAAAAALQHLGLRPGDRVVQLLEAGPQWGPAFFGILDAGLVAVPLSPALGAAGVAAIAARAQPAAAILSRTTEKLAGGLSGVHRLNVADIAPQRRSAPRTGGDGRGGVALLAFTSGTVYQPRGVELTQENLLADLLAILSVRHASPEDAFLSLLHPAHLFEMVVGLLGPLACGARIVHAGPILPNRIVAALRDDGITCALAVPALADALCGEVLDELIAADVIDEQRRAEPRAVIVERLRSELPSSELQALRAAVRARIGSTLGALMIGGAALDPLLAELAEMMGIHVEVGYGLTEAGPVVSLGSARECAPGSAGRPLPGVAVRVASDGEIQVRGPNVMHGYFQDEPATSAAFSDGWLRTGDRGYLDGAGCLHVTGRLKEVMVTSAGETIFPEEAEPHYASSLFKEYCAAGVPGPEGNDRPVLFVVPAASGCRKEEIEAAFGRLRAAAPARLRLERVVVLDQPLPRTASARCSGGGSVAERAANRDERMNENSASLEVRLRMLVESLMNRDLSDMSMDDDLVEKLGLDSLAGLRLLAAVEKRFGVRFPDQRLAEFRTLRHLERYVAAQTGGPP